MVNELFPRPDESPARVPAHQVIRAPATAAAQPRFDLLISGSGLAPLLVAASMLDARGDLALMIACHDEAPGGSSLEPILPRSLPARFARLVEPLVVRAWDKYYVRRPDETHRHDEPVWLIDPVQAWLELEARERPPKLVCIAQNGAGTADTGGVADFAAMARTVIDLPPDPLEAGRSRIVGAAFLLALDAPILADFTLGAGAEEFQQHVPLGDERVAIRTVRCRDASLRGMPVDALLARRWETVARIVGAAAPDP